MQDAVRSTVMSDMSILKGEQIYTPAEVARVLRISPVTVARSIRSGKLKAFRVGGQWRVLGRELIAYIQEETRTALSKPTTRNISSESSE